MREVKYWNAIILALIGGAIGIQELYFNRVGLFILALLFCWTGIPAVVAFIEALSWLFEGEERFYEKYKK